MATPQTIGIVDTLTGKAGTIPADRIADALSSKRFRLEEPDEAEARREQVEYSSTGQQIAAGIEGFGSGATLGIGPLVNRLIDPEAGEQARKRAEYNPVTSTTADIVGGVVPGLLTAGASKLSTAGKLLKYSPAALADRASAAAAAKIAGGIFKGAKTVDEVATAAASAARKEEGQILGEALLRNKSELADQVAAVADVADNLAPRGKLVGRFEMLGDANSVAEVKAARAELDDLLRPSRSSAKVGSKTIKSNNVDPERIAMAFKENPDRARSVLSRLEDATTKLALDPEVLPIRPSGATTLSEIFDVPINLSKTTDDFLSSMAKQAEHAAAKDDTIFRVADLAQDVARRKALTQTTTRGVAEGALFGAGQGVRQSALSEDPVNAESILSNISSSALLGAGVGGLGVLGTHAAAKAVETMGGAAASKLRHISNKALKLNQAAEVKYSKAIEEAERVSDKVARGGAFSKNKKSWADGIINTARQEGFDGTIESLSAMAEPYGIRNLAEASPDVQHAFLLRGAGDYLRGLGPEVAAGTTTKKVFAGLAGRAADIAMGAAVPGNMRLMAKGAAYLGRHLPNIANRVGRAAGEGANLIADAVNAFSKLDVGKATPFVSIAPQKVLERVRFAPAAIGRPPKEKTSQDAFIARSKELDEVMAQPELLRERIESKVAAIQHIDPVLANQIVDAAVRRIVYLHKIKPTDPLAGLRLGKSEWKPSDLDVAEFARKVEFAEDGNKILQGIKSGNMTTESIEVLREVYPDAYLKVQAGIVDRINNNDFQLDFERRTQLGLLFDLPVDPSLDSDNLMQLQSSFQPTDNKQGAQTQPIASNRVSAVTPPSPTKGQELAER